MKKVMKMMVRGIYLLPAVGVLLGGNVFQHTGGTSGGHFLKAISPEQAHADTPLVYDPGGDTYAGDCGADGSGADGGGGDSCC